MHRSRLAIAAAALVVLLGLVLAACGDDGDEAGSSPSASAAASGDASWQQVVDRGKLIVGLCAEYPPFESRDASTNAPVGFDVDLANALGERLGVQVEIVDTAWEGLLGGILKGDFDVLITAMSKEEAAAERVNPSDPYYDLAEIVVTRADDTSIASVDDLKGKVIGVQSACSAEKAVDRLTGLKEVKRYNRNAEAFIDLVAGRSEAVVVGEAYAATEGKKEAGIQITGVKVATNPLVFVSKAGGDALTGQLNAALTELKSDGTYDELVAKWFTFN